MGRAGQPVMSSWLPGTGSCGGVARFGDAAERQKQRKHGSGGVRAGAAPDANVALVPLGELGHDPQTQSRSGIELGGEEGFEDAAHRGTIHADPGVGEGHAHAAGGLVAPIARRPQPDLQPAPARRGLDGVGDQIGKNLLRFAGHACNGRFVRNADFQTDLGDLQAGAEQDQNRVQHLRQLHDLRCAGLAVKLQRRLRDQRDAH